MEDCSCMETRIQEFALEALLSAASVKSLTENGVTQLGAETLHMSLAFFSCGLQTAGHFREQILANTSAYRSTLPKVPLKMILKIRGQVACSATCPHGDPMRHLCYRGGLKSDVKQFEDVWCNFEKFIQEHKIGSLKRRVDHRHITLERDGATEGEFEIEFDRFVLTPWPDDKTKRSLRRRFVCGWATDGFDHFRDALPAPPLESPLVEMVSDLPLIEPSGFESTENTRFHRCSLCGENLSAAAFSRKQLRKCANKRRCSSCV